MAWNGDGEIARRIAAGMLATGLLAFGGWWVLSGDAPPHDRDGAVVNEQPDPPPPPITRRAAGPVGWSIEPAQTVAIAKGDLPASGTVKLDLVLGEPSANAEPLSGRILSIDTTRENRVRELSAVVVGAERGSGRIEVPVEFLIEDTYLIEIQTTEKSHFPLRRYRLEVR